MFLSWLWWKVSHRLKARRAKCINSRVCELSRDARYFRSAVLRCCCPMPLYSSPVSLFGRMQCFQKIMRRQLNVFDSSSCTSNTSVSPCNKPAVDRTTLYTVPSPPPLLLFLSLPFIGLFISHLLEEFGVGIPRQGPVSQQAPSDCKTGGDEHCEKCPGVLVALRPTLNKK